MANTILIKKRGTAGAPVAGDLQLGELAINYSDDPATGQRLYYKDSLGNIQSIASSAITSSVALNNITAAIGSTSINSGANNITWNWSLNGADTGFKIGENVASTGSGNVLFHVATAVGSTADPIHVAVGLSDVFVVDSSGRLSLTALDGTNGASVDVFAGDATTGVAGDVSIRAGNSASGTAGDVQIVAGDGPTPGNTDFVGGDSTSGNKGGWVKFTSGASATGATGDITFETPDVTGTNVNGGDIQFTTGDGAGTGRAGNVTFALGTGGTDGTFTVQQGASDKLVVDAAGLVQVGGATGSQALNVAGGTSTSQIVFTGSSTTFIYDGTGAVAGNLLTFDGTNWEPQSPGALGLGTVTSVAATGSTGLTVGGSPITTTGTLTFTLDTGLQNLATFASTGMLVATGTDTWAARTITGTAGNIVVSNGTGVSANPTIDLAAVGSAVSDQFVKITTDNFGRVTATSAVATSDITALVDTTYVNAAGDTMTGNLTFGGGPQTVTGLPSPVNASDAANKAYVDAAVSGLSWKQAVHVLADANVPLSGSTPLVIDGQTLADQERILLIAQTTGSQNGIYVATITGPTYTLARATDADIYQELNGAAVFVQTGTTYADTGWTQTATLTSFTGQTWIQFSGSNTYVAGAGLNLTGVTFSINFGAGIAQLPSDEVGIDLYNYSGSAIAFADGSGNRVASAAAAVSGDTLHLFLDGSTLTQSGTGLKVADSGITATQLNTSVAGAGLTGGGGTALAVNTTGVSTGIDTDNVIVRSTATAGQVLRSTGTDGAEATWGALNLASSNAVTGVLPAVNGGTGQSTFAVGDIFYADSTTTLAKLPIGTTDQILRVNAGVPQWATTIDGGLF